MHSQGPCSQGPKCKLDRGKSQQSRVLTASSRILFFVLFFTFSLTKCILTLQTLRTPRGTVYFHKLNQHRISVKHILPGPNAIASLDSSFKESVLCPARSVSYEFPL